MSTSYGGYLFTVGERVELSPASDLWMMGAKYGTVTRVMRDGRVQVRVDALNRSFRFRADLLRVVA